jgi:thiol reductant ABC exporter CydC subunit
MKIDRKLWALGKGCYRRFALAFLLSIGATGGSIGLFALAAMLMIQAALHPPFSELQLMIVGIRFFGLLRSVLRYLERYFSHDTTFRLLGAIRVRFYRALEPLFPAYFRKHRSGDLLQRMVEDIDTLQGLFLQTRTTRISALFIGTLLFLVTLQLLGWASLILGFGFLFCAVFIPWIAQIFYRRFQKIFLSLRRLLTDHFCDMTQGFLEITLLGRKNDQLAQLIRLDQELRTCQQKNAVLTGGIVAVSQAVFSLSIYLFLYYLLPNTFQEAIRPYVPAAFVLAFFAAEETLTPLIPSAFRQEDCRISGQRLVEILETEPSFPQSGQELPKKAENRLDFIDLTFLYPEQTSPALQQINFHVSEGSRIAIVGPSGSGKSSLFFLLLRFYDFQKGTISIGGENIRTFSPESVRKIISWSSQMPDFFHGTIRENLMLETENREQLSWAADLMQSKDWIESLPDGYETCIGEFGARLSAGQRKRIDLMRAVLKDAPILLFDEPLQHLDRDTANRIWNAITTQLSPKTLLVISHHFLQMERFDQILVLHRGKLVELGKHQDLLECNGLYRRMWLRQKGKCP